MGSTTMVPPMSDQRGDRADGADVEHRRGDQVDLVVAPQLVGADQHHATRRAGSGGRAPLPWAPRGAGGVHDQRGGVLGHVDGGSGGPLSSTARSYRDLAPLGVAHGDERDGAGPCDRLRPVSAPSLVREQQRGPGVVEDVGDLAAREPEVHRHADGAEPVRREHDLHELGPVAHQHGHAGRRRRHRARRARRPAARRGRAARARSSSHPGTGTPRGRVAVAWRSRWLFQCARRVERGASVRCGMWSPALDRPVPVDTALISVDRR